MKLKETIKFTESYSFRKARIIWPFLFGFVALGIMIENPWLLFISAILYIITTIYILAWRCPRCNSLYCVKFGIISIAWPFFNSCIHCASELEKEPS
jgi:hypothetical protein